MAKIPFDIKFRPQIESGEFKVETRDGRPARIVCWDRQSEDFPLVVLTSDDKGEDLDVYTMYGKFYCNQESPAYDLIIITPDPELSELGSHLYSVFESVDCRDTNMTEEELTELARKQEKVILALARKELQPEIDAEVEKAYKNADRMQYEKGREDALKDRPTWKKCEDGNKDRLELEALCREAGSPIEIAFRANGYRIFLSDLEKLPKED